MRQPVSWTGSGSDGDAVARGGGDGLSRRGGPVGRPGGWLRSFADAARGARAAWQTERNLRVQCAAGFPPLALAVLMRLPLRDGALLVGLVAVVLSAEVMNTAIEVAVDLSSPGVAPLARQAKDLGAGAVLTASAGALVAGVLLFWPFLRRPGGLAGLWAHPAATAACGLAEVVLVVLAVMRPRRRDIR